MSFRRNPWPYAVSIAFVTLALDTCFGTRTLTGAGYLLALGLALASPRAWHALALAAFSVLSLLAVPLAMRLAGHAEAEFTDHALLIPLVIGVWAIGRSVAQQLRAESHAGEARTASALDELRAALAHAAEAENRRRQGLDQLAIATQMAGVSIWEWDFGTDMLSAAQGSPMRRRLGRDCINGLTFFHNSVHADDRARVQAAFDAAFKQAPGSDDRVVLRYRWVLQDGGVRHIELYARAVRDATGRVIRALGADRDVTEEVEAALELERHAAQLREAESRLERASRSSLEGHWELDYVRQSRWHSASFQALLGHEAQPLHGALQDARAHTHPDDVALATAAYQRHLENGAPYDVVVRLQTAQGVYRWYRMRGGASRDEHGRPLRVAGSAQDVHQQKLAEDALREAQARFERAVHGTQDGLWELDWAGAEERLWLSPRVSELLGFAVGELPDHLQALRERIHAEDLSAFDAALRTQVQQGLPIDVEVRMRTRAESYRWYRLRGSAGRDATGRVIRTSGSMQDVTEARAAQEALVSAKEAAQAASRAKSAFLATMSHEIRTPMNGIIGMSALLIDTVLARVQREYVEAIRSSANSLLAIINDILDFSKIEAGKLEIESVEMNLHECIEEVGALLGLQAGLKDLEPIVDVMPDVPQLVLGDPQRIRQCLVNLLSNAIKFTSTGEVLLEVSASEQTERDAQVRFEVRDTGIGIAPAALPDLFQPFTQADSSTTRKFGGTGLGLSIVKRLVELMHGQLGVVSEPAKGSNFWFTLPLARCAGAPRSEPAGSERGRRVLLVDDNDTSRRVLRARLVGHQLEVEAVASGATALESLRQAARERRPFEIALIDAQMPHVDGARLAEQIGADAQLVHTRRVLLGTPNRRLDGVQLVAAGFAGFLAKPVRERELRECLRHVLAHEASEWSTGTLPPIAGIGIDPGAALSAYGVRVLVVEDNAVNQKVAQKFLERLGCSVVLAADGAEAVQLSAAEHFGLILMDMQMPVMDGTTATRAIRARESASGASRTPIVALTANVLAVQFQSCLDAGMDDVLPKPLEAARLQEVLERLVKAPSAAGAPALARGPNLASGPLDLARLASIAGEDTAFMRELVAAFRTSAASVLAAMRAELAAPTNVTAERLQSAAHKLKGASDNVGAQRLRELAQRVESKAQEAAPHELVGWVEAIATELAELDEFFSSAELATFARRQAS